MSLLVQERNTKDPGAQSVNRVCNLLALRLNNCPFLSCVPNFRHLPLRCVDLKDRNMSAVDRAAAHGLKGEIDTGETENWALFDMCRLQKFFVT